MIAELRTLIDEAKQIRHNVFRPQVQPKDNCPDVKMYGENIKEPQRYYHQLAVDIDEELERKEALLLTYKLLEIESEKALCELEEAHKKLTERGRQEWEEYRKEYFAKYPERKARYEAYLAAGGKPVEW
ncbi:MAG: hypothetical protein ACI4JK_03610 [Oscillospiraceae bacterium]